MVEKRVVLMVLTLMLVGATLASSQESGRVEGRIVRSDGLHLGGVKVKVDELAQEAFTDGEGRFAFDDVPAGAYTLTFSLGERSVNQTGVEVSAGATTTVDKTVDWDVSFAEAITVVSASRREERITEAPAAVTVISEQEIERKAATGQVPKLLEFSPGVDYTQSGLYDINFNTRGFNSSLNRRILTLIDGRDPSVPFLGSQEWAAVSFPMDELSNVELVRGPGAALYGANAFNGVLNMTTKPPRGHEGTQLRVTGGELATGRADFRWADGLGAGWYFKLVGGYQQSDDFTLSRNESVEYSKFCTATGQTNCLRKEAKALALTEGKIGFGGLRFDKHFDSGRVLTVEGGTASLEGPTFVTGIGRVQVTDTQRPWTRANFNTLHWNFLGYYDQRKAEDQLALSSGALLFEDSSNLHGEIQGNASFAGGKGFLVGGVAYNQQEVDTANHQGVQTLMAEAKSEDQQAIFGQLEYALTAKLKGVVAARVDDSTLHDTQFSPKASLVYAFTPNQTMRLTYNRAFQVPNYSEFFLRAPAGTPITAFAPLEDNLRPLLGERTLGLRSIPILALGNGDLDVEKIRSYELGYNAIVSRKLFLTLDYYRNRVEDFVTDLLPGVNSAFGPYAPPSFLPAQVQAQILATLRGGLGPVNFSGLTTVNGLPALVLSYTNAGVVDTQGIDLTLNYYVSDRWKVDGSYSWFDFEVKERNERDQLLPNAPDNKLSAGLSYGGESFDAGVKYRWVDGFPWAAGIFVGDVPSYGLVDLSLGYRFTGNWKVGLDVSNLLDKVHYQSFGGDLIGRRALGYVTVGW